jgi:hypothetical protein
MNAYNVLIGKPEARKSLGRPGSRCKGNITPALRVGSCEHGDELSGSIKGV